MKTTAWLLFFSITAFAQTTKPTKTTQPNEPLSAGPATTTMEKQVETGKDKVEEARQVLAATKDHRAASKWTTNAHYSLFEMWVPGKWGGSIGYVRSASSTYDLEYSRASFGLGTFGVDVGSVTEQRFVLGWRSYGRRNSFHFLSGLNYTKLEVKLGNKYLSSVPGMTRTSVDFVSLETLGVTWGIASRWQTKGGFTWGLDWLVIHIPLVTLSEHNAFDDYTANTEYSQEVDDTLGWFKHIPSFAVAKVQLGFTF
jgi:hypothetical protein